MREIIRFILWIIAANITDSNSLSGTICRVFLWESSGVINPVISRRCDWGCTRCYPAVILTNLELFLPNWTLQLDKLIITTILLWKNIPFLMSCKLYLQLVIQVPLSQSSSDLHSQLLEHLILKMIILLLIQTLRDKTTGLITLKTFPLFNFCLD